MTLAEDPSPYIANKLLAKELPLVLDEEGITHAVLLAAEKVHIALGFSLSKSAYEAAMLQQLYSWGLRVERVAPAFLVQEEVTHKGNQNASLVVAGLVAVKLEAVQILTSAHSKRLLRDLLLLNLKTGLLINFGNPSLDDNMRRVINGAA